MLKILLFIMLSVTVKGHSGKIQREAAMQSALMPQELNPAFVPDKDSPWREVLPIRQRRDVSSEVESGLTKLKTYSRAVTYVVLAISVAIEVIVYLVELYSTN